jgi:signal transduction histidine kinase
METQQEFLGIIDDEADKLSEQIENLLDSFRLKSQSADLQLKWIPLDAFFKGILDKLSNQDLNLEINLEILPSDLEIFVDSKMLSQVVTNMISNASKYAPNSILEIRAFSTGANIQLMFEDNGPGIAPEHLDNIFKQFYRVPERSGGVRGTGLGLFICQQIVTAHNGKIWVESIVGQGSTFFITIPNSPTDK